MFPINLVLFLSDFRYKIKTSLPVIWHEKIDWKIQSVPNEHTQLILVDLVDDEETEELRVHELGCLQLTMQSKETEELVHSSWSTLSIITSYLLYIGLAIELNIAI